MRSNGQASKTGIEMHGSFHRDEGDKGDVRHRVLGSNFCWAFLSISLPALAARQAVPPIRVMHTRELPRRFPATWFIPFIPVILFFRFLPSTHFLISIFNPSAPPVHE